MSERRELPISHDRPNFENYARQINAPGYPLPPEDGPLNLSRVAPPHVNGAELVMLDGYRRRLGAEDAADQSEPRDDVASDATAPMTLAEYTRRFGATPGSW